MSATKGEGRLPPIAISALFAIIGAGITTLIGLAALGATDASHLLLPLAIAVVLTVCVTAAARYWLADTSLRTRFLTVATVATAIGLANLTVLALLMAVSGKDAILVAILLVYSTAAAIGAGLTMARASVGGATRLAAAAERIAAGDLDARAGRVGGGAELEGVARALDEMADRLAVSMRRERAAEAQRRDLIVAVSHDLRTPLADLRAMVEAIEDRVVDDPATVQSYAARMGDAIGSLSTLVDDLFEFVQLDAGAIETETERARVDQVVRSALDACDGRALEKGLVVRTELGDAAGAACSPRLTRVVQNLLQNAIRHTPADGTVVVEARHAPAGIELAVADSGEGIEAESVEHVFEPFWRGDAARESDGAGLGLALAKRIVEGLGGTIAVESSPQWGSRFAVFVPETRLP